MWVCCWGGFGQPFWRCIYYTRPRVRTFASCTLTSFARENVGHHVFVFGQHMASFMTTSVRSSSQPATCACVSANLYCHVARLVCIVLSSTDHPRRSDIFALRHFSQSTNAWPISATVSEWCLLHGTTYSDGDNCCLMGSMYRVSHMCNSLHGLRHIHGLSLIKCVFSNRVRTCKSNGVNSGYRDKCFTPLK
jgi:hypothetical protein